MGAVLGASRRPLTLSAPSETDQRQLKSLAAIPSAPVTGRHTASAAKGPLLVWCLPPDKQTLLTKYRMSMTVLLRCYSTISMLQSSPYVPVRNAHDCVAELLQYHWNVTILALCTCTECP
ncbi:hypothetical protein RRG08_064524 [Elysia crispata]|uniref:Uncharacterized protein n=1 Tax=Elysia crispata TaxID=231223 RepID=A0AAE0XZJ5_9GAST|nr:hypothetical protein RRG08_064524 [Elysia crispata]